MARISGVFAAVAIAVAAIGAAHAPNLPNLNVIAGGGARYMKPESTIVYLFIFPGFLFLAFYNARFFPNEEAREKLNQHPTAYTILSILFSCVFLGLTIYRVVRVFEMP